jgi:hypothetical protein
MTHFLRPPVTQVRASAEQFGWESANASFFVCHSRIYRHQGTIADRDERRFSE